MSRVSVLGIVLLCFFAVVKGDCEEFKTHTFAATPDNSQPVQIFVNGWTGPVAPLVRVPGTGLVATAYVASEQLDRFEATTISPNDHVIYFNIFPKSVTEEPHVSGSSALTSSGRLMGGMLALLGSYFFTQNAFHYAATGAALASLQTACAAPSECSPDTLYIEVSCPPDLEVEVQQTSATSSSSSGSSTTTAPCSAAPIASVQRCASSIEGFQDYCNGLYISKAVTANNTFQPFSVSWTGCVTTAEYAIGTQRVEETTTDPTDEMSNIVEWTAFTGNFAGSGSTDINATFAALPHNTSYYINVKLSNTYGTTYKASGAVLIDLTPPTTGSVGQGGSVGTHNPTTAISTSLTINWWGQEDPESGSYSNRWAVSSSCPCLATNCTEDDLDDILDWAPASSGSSAFRSGINLPVGVPLYIRFQNQNWVRLWSEPACAEFTVV